MTTNSQNPETIGLHGGTFRRDESQTSVAVPIHQTTTPMPQAIFLAAG